MDELSVYVSNAMQEWEKGTEHKSISSYNNAISFFLLAIKKAGSPVPRLHSFLSMAYYELASLYSSSKERNSAQQAGKYVQLAKEQANAALSANQLEFRAQLVRTYIASDELLYLDGGISNLVPKSSGIVEGIFESIGRAAGTGVAAARVQSSKNNFRNEVAALLSIYNKLFAEYYLGVDEFLYCTEQLFQIADYCAPDRLFDVKQIYSGILGVEINDLKYDEFEDDDIPDIQSEIIRMRALAEGRLMMR